MKFLWYATFFFFDTLHDSFDWTIAYYCHFRTVLCGLGEVLKVKKMGTYFCLVREKIFEI